MVEESFKQIKVLQTKSVLKLLGFNLLFELLECDASVSGIGVVLIKAGHHFSYFSEKLAEAGVCEF